MAFKKKITLRYPPHKDSSRRSYSVNIPKPALKQVNWDLKKMANKKSLICTVDYWETISFRPIEVFESLPSEEYKRKVKEAQKPYKERWRVDIRFLKIWLEKRINNFSLSHLKESVPRMKKEVQKAKKELELHEYGLELVKLRIKELEKQQKEAKSSKKALKKGTK